MSGDRRHLVNPGGRLPEISLPAAPGGEPVRLRGNGRQAPVIVLVHETDCPACRAYVERIAARHEALLEWDGRVLVGMHGSLQEAARLREHSEPPFPVVSDSEKRLRAGRGLQPPALMIADQWGEVHLAQSAGEEHAFLPPEEIVDWLRYLAIQCPECEGESL